MNKDELKRQINEIEHALRCGKTSSKYADLLANYTSVSNARAELKRLKDMLKSHESLNRKGAPTIWLNGQEKNLSKMY